MQELQGYLLEQLGFGMTPVANDMEHSLEIELPFLQRALAKPFSLVPLMLRDQSSRLARGLGGCLARLICAGRRWLANRSPGRQHRPVAFLPPVRRRRAGRRGAQAGRRLRPARRAPRRRRRKRLCLRLWRAGCHALGCQRPGRRPRRWSCAMPPPAMSPAITTAWSAMAPP